MHSKEKKELGEAAAFFSGEEEMAKSVREGMGKTKFVTGELLHNCNTKEDGLVTKVYALGTKVMYEVAVPATPNTWAECYVSDWAENTLEPSRNANPPTDKLTFRSPV